MRMAWARTAQERTVAHEAPQRRVIHPFAGRAVGVIAALVAVAHLVAAVAGGRGYWFDEMYMLAVGRNHLDWGSADQPPVAPLIAWTADAFAPGSIVALRLPAIVATVAAVVVVALIARELGGDGRAQWIAAAAQATSVSAALFGHWLTPYALEPVQWLVLLWLLVRWVRVRHDRLLLLAGLVVGIAAETKFQVALLCAGVVIGLVMCGPRQIFGRPLLWVGAVVAALLAVPTLIWQAAHGWPQWAMSEVVVAEMEVLYGGRLGASLQMLLWAGVLGTLLMAYGLWCLLRAEELRPYRFVAVAFLVVLMVFVLTGSRPYYLAGFHGALVAAGTVGFQLRREGGVGRWGAAVWPGLALGVVLTALVLSVSVPISNSDVGERIAASTAGAYGDLSAGEQRRTVLFGKSYILAAYLDGYSERFDLPPAHSPNRAYGYFPLPDESSTDVLFTGTDPSDLEPYFTDVREVRGPVGDDIDARVWLLTGRTTGWNEIWQEIRTLDVA